MSRYILVPLGGDIYTTDELTSDIFEWRKSGELDVIDTLLSKYLSHDLGWVSIEYYSMEEVIVVSNNADRARGM